MSAILLSFSQFDGQRGPHAGGFYDSRGNFFVDGQDIP